MFRVEKVIATPPVFASAAASSFNQRGAQARGNRRSEMTISTLAQSGTSCSTGTR